MCGCVCALGACALQVLVSGGWDRSVKVWDLRIERAVRSVFGPYVCGDALSVRGGRLLTGSWRHSAALQQWDLASGRLMTNLTFHQVRDLAVLGLRRGGTTQLAEMTVGEAGMLLCRLPQAQAEHEACLIYCAKFGEGHLDGLLYAGGSGKRPCFRLYQAVRSNGGGCNDGGCVGGHAATLR